MASRIITLGKRKYVLGMNWQESAGMPVGELLDQHVLKQRPFWIKIKNDKDSMIGWAPLAADAKGPHFSYAGAVAARTKGKALYIAELGDGDAWVCIIEDGIVSANSDAISSLDDAIRQVKSFQNILDGYDLFLAGGAELWGEFPGAIEFDSEALVEGAKRCKLNRYDSSGGVAKGVLGLALLAGAGFFMMSMFGDDKEQALLDQQQADKDAYIASSRGQVDWSWLDSTWLADAWDRSAVVAPAEAAGWTRQVVSCSSTRCLATYNGGGQRSLRGLKSVIGDAGKVEAISPTEVTVMFQLPALPEVFVEDAVLLNPERAVSAIETATDLISKYADFTVESAASTNPIGGGIPVPEGAVAAVVSKFSIRGAAPDRARVMGAVEHFGLSGWVVSGMAVRPSDFTLEFSRLEAVQ